VAEHGALSACETDVGSESELAARAAGSPSDRGDSDRRQLLQPNDNVHPGVKAGRSGWECVDKGTVESGDVGPVLGRRCAVELGSWVLGDAR
jgi:hypothetical protein